MYSHDRNFPVRTDLGLIVITYMGVESCFFFIIHVSFRLCLEVKNGYELLCFDA